MISLILPYWDRKEAADAALRQLDATYPDIDLEIIVVDDGNKVRYVPPPGNLNVRVVYLPEKDIPMCPATAWNAGVKAASGEIIVLSCVEILHTVPVLEQMAANVRNIGPLGYVLAAAWCPESEGWHCHSTIKTPRNPWGTGIAFCGAMYREMYWKAGGMDEAYRDGAGYEDNDFINRMLVAGARFVIRDDLVVTHPKTGATIEWGLPKLQRNADLYYAKWPTELQLNSITFCCVNAGNYLGRGREYVEKLYGMLLNCLPDGFVFKFLCFTDEPFEHEAIKCKPLPMEGLAGWDNKIALFKPGVFGDGERVVFLDLDTLLVGRIDRLLDYQGEFATLRDFWRPEGLGPAVMLWRGGYTHPWDAYEAAGRPQLERGDAEWIEKVCAPEILQDLFPGAFCSYKVDCKPHPPNDARVVCFHGLPRPHEVEGWAKQVWDGELTGSALELLCNTEKAQLYENIRTNSARSLPWLDHVPAHDGEILLIGGGPSLADSLDQIKAKIAKGAKVLAMNGTAKYLADRGIHVDMHISIDARESNKRFLGFADRYYLATQCHPSMFDVEATMFHVSSVDWDKHGDVGMAIGGGHAVGLYAMSLAYVLGYRAMHLYGYDSSYRDSHHAYEQPKNDSDPIIEAIVMGRKFKTTNWMVVQVNEFRELAHQLSKMGCQITTHGDGLLPYVAFQMATLAQAA